jgi:tetraacyldisaccharide 4'-kinase
LFLDDFLLPAGNLRESRSGAKRANSIIVTKCPQNLSEEKQNELRKKLTVSPNQQVFFSTINYHSKTLGSLQISIDVLHEYEIILITGIANPTPLVEFLKGRYCKIQHIAFSDHHHFTSQEIDKIKFKYDEITSDKKIVLTTEKDYMRLVDQISELSYLEIATEFLEGKERFINDIKSFCRIDS